MNRTERLLNLIVALLETRRPLSAEEIRDTVAGYGDEPSQDAFRRAFERDKEDLREMGVPIEAVPRHPLDDVADGYIISKSDYYLPEIELQPEEIATLRLATRAVLGDSSARSGFLKLAAEHAGDPPFGRRVPVAADVGADDALVAELFGATSQRRPVTFTYTSATGDTTERTVEPYGLVQRGGRWYLVGRDVDRDAVRSFKLDRIQGSVSTLTGTYDIPAGFDAAERIKAQAWEIGAEPVEAVVRFDESVRWWAAQNLPEARTADGPGGSLDVTIEVANLDALVSWALGFADQVEIVSPEEARARLVRHLEPWLT